MMTVFCSLLAATFVLAERGRPAACEIVVPSEPAPAVAYAADELRDGIERTTGVRLPIVRQGSGRAAATVRLGLDAPEPSLGEDGFRLASGTNVLSVVGSSARGVLYGVYEVLERFAGIGFYAVDCTHAPALDRLTVPADLNETQVPTFEMREPFWFDSIEHPEFAARLRINCRSWRRTPAKFGGEPHRFGKTCPSAHTFARLLPPERHFDAHPEYFSLVDGKRRRHESQLCLTNPEVLALVTSNLLAAIRADPEARYFGVSQNDWRNFCECSRCAAVDAEEESHAGTLIRFVNRVAEAVEREFPDKIVETLAYQYTRKPPKLTRPRHNVMPCLCSIEGDFSTPFAEGGYEQNVSFAEDLRRWAGMCDRLYVWDYSANFDNVLLPYPNERVFRPNLELFRRSGVRNIFVQGVNMSSCGDMAEYKLWLLSKLMWNLKADEAALSRRFLEDYYGAAAKPIADYLRLRRELAGGAKLPLRINEHVATERLTDAFVEQATELWRQARLAVTNDAPRLRHVERGALSIDYLRLQRAARLMPFRTFGVAAERGEVASACTLARDFLDRVARIGHVRFAENAGLHGRHADRIRKLATWADKPVPDTAEETVMRLWTEKWGRFQADPQAADGRALMLYADFFNWAAQMMTDEMSYRPGRPHRLSVRIRIERPAGAVEGEAFQCGIWDVEHKKSRSFLSVKAGEAGEGYRWYDLPAWTPTDRQYFWISPGKYDGAKFPHNPSVSAIYLDQLKVRP